MMATEWKRFSNEQKCGGRLYTIVRIEWIYGYIEKMGKKALYGYWGMDDEK